VASSRPIEKGRGGDVEDPKRRPGARDPWATAFIILSVLSYIDPYSSVTPGVPWCSPRIAQSP